MKKLLIVLGAFAFVAGLTLNASAACQSCKGNIGRVPMPKATSEQGSTTCTPTVFDYDGNPDDFGTLAGYTVNGQYGYCVKKDGTSDWNASAAKPRGARNVKLLFKICECDTSALNNELTPDYLPNGVGIRMSIKTAGVYWAAPNVAPTTVIPDVPLGSHPEGSQTDIALDTHPLPTDIACADGATAGNLSPYGYGKSFGTVTYYDDEYLGTVRAPDAGLTCTATPLASRSQALQSDADQGYHITDDDIDRKVSVWWIDVPPMGIDPTVAKEGAFVTLKVELLGDRQGTICLGCMGFCECTWDLAIIGCLTESMSESLRFPYLVQQTSPWGTGIALTNLGFGTVAAPKATFILTDSTGTSFKADVDMTGKAVWGWELDKLISGAGALNWESTPAGKTVTPGYAWLCVTGNFPMDGYSYLCDDKFGAGTLPRMDVSCE